ncbi:uncharacterized protein LACBIDRAFT_293734, partial [Laccaria bicolor S238N-H82]
MFMEHSSKSFLRIYSEFFPSKSTKSSVEAMGPPHAASNGELAAPLIGAMIAFAMYGALICQAAWYFRAFPKDPLYLKILQVDMVLFHPAGNWRRPRDFDKLQLLYSPRACVVSSRSLQAFFVPTLEANLISGPVASKKNYILAAVVVSLSTFFREFFPYHVLWDESLFKRRGDRNHVHSIDPTGCPLVFLR